MPVRWHDFYSWTERLIYPTKRDEARVPRFHPAVSRPSQRVAASLSYER